MNSDSLTQWGFGLREKWVNDRRTRAGFQRRISDHERVEVGILHAFVIHIGVAPVINYVYASRTTIFGIEGLTKSEFR